VENPKKADKPESKTGMVVLGAVLAVSVLVNVGLGWVGCYGREKSQERNSKKQTNPRAKQA